MFWGVFVLLLLSWGGCHVLNEQFAAKAAETVPSPVSESEQKVKLLYQEHLAKMQPEVREKFLAEQRADKVRRQQEREQSKGWFFKAIGVTGSVVYWVFAVVVVGGLCVAAIAMIYQGVRELSRPGNDAVVITRENESTLRVRRPGVKKLIEPIDIAFPFDEHSQLRCRTDYRAAQGADESRTPESWTWCVTLDGKEPIGSQQLNFQLHRQRDQPIADVGPPSSVQRFAQQMSTMTNLPIVFRF